MAVLSRPAASSPALVLRTWACGETSVIASLLTRDHGFVKVIAKAARRPRSTLRPLVEPGRIVAAEFSLDPGRELQYLRGGAVDLDPMAGGLDLEQSAYLLGALELVDRCRPSAADGAGAGSDEGAAPGLFGICLEFLRVLSSPSCRRTALLFFAFEWELLARHGLSPEVTACASCGRARAAAPAGTLRFDPAEGGLVCGTCGPAGSSGQGRPISAAALDLLAELDARGIALDTTVEDPARPVRREVGGALHRFLGYHLPGYRLPTALDLLRAGKEQRG
jgi:DNA repair protein RecO (recombination protein O)